MGQPLLGKQTYAGHRFMTGTLAKQADRCAIDVLGIPSLKLMENASMGAAKLIMSETPANSKYVILCGTGNNGADGLCIGRLLKEAGRDAVCIATGNPAKATREYNIQLEQAAAAGVEVLRYEADPNCLGKTAADSPNAVLVDAVFGIGLHREVTGEFKELIDAANKLRRGGTVSMVYSVDVPSGLDSDGGRVMGTAIIADATVTFGCVKTGLVMQDGKSVSGRIACIDIGIPDAAYDRTCMLLTTLCYIEKDGRYLMLYRNKKEHDVNEGKWIGVGGKLEPGEDADECIIRETMEETGLRLTNPELRGVIYFISDEADNEVMFLYTAAEFEGTCGSGFACDEGELRWMPVSDIPGLNLWDGDRIFLKRLADGERNIRLTLCYEGGRLVRTD